MKIKGEPRAFLSNEARQLLNLYESLGERAEIFLPRHIYDNLTSFVKLCFEEPGCPAVGDQPLFVEVPGRYSGIYGCCFDALSASSFQSFRIEWKAGRVYEEDR